MSVDRMKRVNELLRREIGQALFRLVNEAGFDMSAVTVTHVDTTRNLRYSKVMISIRDHVDERGKMLSQIRKHRKEIQAQINTNLSLKFTPRLSFELDNSLERGDHILDVLHKMELESEAPTADEPPIDEEQ